MTSIRWSSGDSIGVFDANTPLHEILSETQTNQSGWIVLQRTWAAGHYFYAFQRQELAAFAINHPDRIGRIAVEALDLHEFGSSQGSSPAPAAGQSYTWQPPEQTVYLPSMLRTVRVDTQGNPVGIGEIEQWTGQRAPFMDNFAVSDSRLRQMMPPMPFSPRSDSIPGEDRDWVIKKALGDLLGGSQSAMATPTPPASDPAATAQAILSAQGPQSVAVDEEAIIDIRLELADGAEPLAHRLETPISLREKIVAILSVDNRLLRVRGPRLAELEPPAAGQPSLYPFQVQGVRAGTASISVMFRQGGSDLGTVSFKVSVIAGAGAGASAAALEAETVSASVVAMRRVPSDDDVLILLINQEFSGNRIYFEYQAYWTPLPGTIASSNPNLSRHQSAELARQRCATSKRSISAFSTGC